MNTVEIKTKVNSEQMSGDLQILKDSKTEGESLLMAASF